jgi:hypothetical protein
MTYIQMTKQRFEEGKMVDLPNEPKIAWYVPYEIQQWVRDSGLERAGLRNSSFAPENARNWAGPFRIEVFDDLEFESLILGKQNSDLLRDVRETLTAPEEHTPFEDIFESLKGLFSGAFQSFVWFGKR